MHMRTKKTLPKKGNQLTNETSFHFMNIVSSSTTTTSSVVKPLGAGFYWKPVALTKNSTVVMYGARLADVPCAQWPKENRHSEMWQHLTGNLGF